MSLTDAERIAALRTVIDAAKVLVGDDEPIVRMNAPRILAIAHDSLREVDLTYDDDIVDYE